MSTMGQALERRAGGRLKSLLGRLTTGKAAGLLTGLVITGVIQSSSATTVMVVGFVNSGLMDLRQAINVIMGANIGTTVTAWILSLSGISGSSVFVQLLKPSSFTPVLALIGVIFLLFCKNEKKKDTGTILLGFATLMFGMETMSSAVAGLKDVPEFASILTLFSNPILGVAAGAVLTAVIQSSSASVGILQALSATGQITLGAAIPIVMGQNIGTCVTAMLSSIGTNKNARRAALVHLSFNVIGTIVWLTVFCVVRAVFAPAILGAAASQASIAAAHSAFNILCTALLLPLSGRLEALAMRLIPDGRGGDTTAELDERLLATPSLAVERCRGLTGEMARCAVEAVDTAIASLDEYDDSKAFLVRGDEDRTDHYEDAIGTYLVKLSARKISESDSAESAKLLCIICDFERIADHATNILEAAEEIYAKQLTFSSEASSELKKMTGAVHEILGLAVRGFAENDLEAARSVAPLEEVVDMLRERLRNHHISRMQQGRCTAEAGFIWADLLTDLERIADHCSNIAGCVLDTAQSDLKLHEYVRTLSYRDPEFKRRMAGYAEKYALD
jgi:phosphate:Na+ symporter